MSIAARMDAKLANAQRFWSSPNLRCFAPSREKSSSQRQSQQETRAVPLASNGTVLEMETRESTVRCDCARAISPAFRDDTMNPFVALGVLLLAIWAVLWLGFHVVSGLIHLLVIVAVVMIVWGLVKRGASAVGNSLS